MQYLLLRCATLPGLPARPALGSGVRPPRRFPGGRAYASQPAEVSREPIGAVKTCLT